MSFQQPTVLVIGATGQAGRLIVEDLNHDPGNIRLRLVRIIILNEGRIYHVGN